LWPKEPNSDRVPPRSGETAAAVDARVKKPAPFGKYYLLERINVGGMAEVFRAKAFGVEGFERLVAVKRILPNIAEDKEFIRMFIEEAKLSVQLNHANIAQIFDLGVVDGSYYIALEHVHGRDLRGIFDRCRNMGEPMPVAQACFVVMKVCEGLDYAHNKRDQSGRELSLVHRDVSPQNVLVSFEGEVKLIDFGIAKAAGKGSKTQAGILKGKFGYMSPEQVRGLPVSRQSDVFSCGIVLYELLTGERLFVGESDFSTLEKVRNVEILPPSTYNRRIPDELERIVLKALAKDVDDRYQNAIDLHDELQAFVYTAGEFYSRKDLAGWMKKTFGKEIEEETAKLESYRQLKPPAEPPPTRTLTGSRPPIHTPAPRRSTQAVAATKPPPPPRVSQQDMSPAATARGMAAAPRPRPDESGELAWDEDELETQIYDNPEDDPRNKPPGARASKPLPLQAPASQPGMQQVAAVVGGDQPGAPDLSSLVGSTAKGWESGTGSLPSVGNGAPAKFATGSHKTVAPSAAPIPSLVPPPATAMSAPAIPVEPPLTNGAPLLFDTAQPPIPAAPPLFDPMASFGSHVAPRRDSKRAILMIAIGGAVVAALAVVLVIALSGDSTTPTEQQAADPRPQPAVADENTGFDLYVTPAGITHWKLDGEARTDKLPSRIRGITPGVHSVQIDPPPGFMSHTQQVTVEGGKAERVTIVLQPIPGIVGLFESTPPGATVSLIVDGERQPPLGESPQEAPLDPRKTYQVLFEKAGYVSVNRPVVFTGNLKEKVLVGLEKAGPVAVVDDKKPDPRIERPLGDPKIKKPDPKPDPKIVKTDPKPDPKPDVVVGDTKPDPKPDPKPDVKKPTGTGTLAINSKPPCEIYVNGVATGLRTPQPKMSLPAGKHRITLINNEFGINEKFTVEIKPDGTERVLKDWSDRLPQ
jgi:eukaryotic-like serine/threonine-protein kinase